MIIEFPEFRDELDSTKYPFADDASLTNAQQDLFVEGTFIDASFYPIGGESRMYVAKVTLTNQKATIYIGDAGTQNRCSGTFDIINPPSIIRFIDKYNRPAGMIVSDPTRLSIFQSWSVGDHTFRLGDTEFAASCCVPQPASGVRGIVLEDGTVFTGDVWLVGEDGVVLRKHHETLTGVDCGDSPQQVAVIRMDVVGDPLFRRRLCTSPGLFASPQFIRSITIKRDCHHFTCLPDSKGDFKISVGHNEAKDTVLRVNASNDGIQIGVVGDPMTTNV